MQADVKTSMRVAQAVNGVFHHFDLARELLKRGHLEKVYSTWPWQRLEREGLPRAHVGNFPWIHTPLYLLERTGKMPARTAHEFAQLNGRLFDRWLRRELQQKHLSGVRLDALVALSGTGTLAGEWLQREGGAFICDRGSTHHRFQAQILREEYRLWDFDLQVSDPRATAVEERQYEIADAITLPSQASLRSFLDLGVPADKLHVIPYGVNLERFVPSGMPAADRFDVLFAGGISLRKGIPYLLQAFAALKHPHKHLRLAGNVDPLFRPLLSTLPMTHVELVGSLSQQQLAATMSRSHVLVLPSIEDGFGLVLNQAMACGCPVIASAHTGGPDLITEGVDGFVVPIRDSIAVGDRLQQLADDPQLQNSMRNAAVQKVAQAGGWTEYGDRWEQLLFQLRSKRN